MEDLERIRNRWTPVVTATWLLAVITLLVAIWLITQHGIVETSTTNRFGGVETATRYNITVWAAGIGQTIGAVLLALLFTMVNQIHQTTTDIWVQNQRALRHRDN